MHLISPLIVVGILMLLSAHTPLYLPPLSPIHTSQTSCASSRRSLPVWNHTHDYVRRHFFALFCCVDVVFLLWWRMKSIDACVLHHLFSRSICLPPPFVSSSLVVYFDLFLFPLSLVFVLSLPWLCTCSLLV